MLYTLKPSFSRNFIGVTCDEDADLSTLYWLLIRNAIFSAPEDGDADSAWLSVMRSTAEWSDVASKIVNSTFAPTNQKLRSFRTLLEPRNLCAAYGIERPLALFLSYFFGMTRLGAFDLSFKVKMANELEAELDSATSDGVLTAGQAMAAALAFKFFDEDFDSAFQDCITAARAQLAQNSQRTDSAIILFDQPTVRKILGHFSTFCAQVRDAADEVGSIRFNYDAQYYLPHIRAAIATRKFKSKQNEQNEHAVLRCEDSVDELLLCSNLLQDVIESVEAGELQSLLKVQIADGVVRKAAELFKQMREARVTQLPATTGQQIIALRCPTKVVQTASHPALVYDIAATARPFMHVASKTKGDNGWSISTKAYLTDAFTSCTQGVYAQLVREADEVTTLVAEASRGDVLIAQSLSKSILDRLRALGPTVLLDFLAQKGGCKDFVRLAPEGTTGIRYRAKGAWMSLARLTGGSFLRPDGAISEQADLALVVFGILLLNPVGTQDVPAATPLGSVLDLLSSDEAKGRRDRDDVSGARTSSGRRWEYEDIAIEEMLNKPESSGLGLINITEVHTTLFKPTAFAASGKLSYAATADKYSADSPLKSIPIEQVWTYLGVSVRRFLFLRDLQMTLHAALLKETLAAVAASSGATASGKSPLGTAAADDVYLFHLRSLAMIAREKFMSYVVFKLEQEGVSFNQDRLKKTDYAIQLNSALTCSCVRVLTSVLNNICPDLAAAVKHVVAAAEAAGARKHQAIYDIGSLDSALAVAVNAE